MALGKGGKGSQKMNTKKRWARKALSISTSDKFRPRQH